MSRSEGIIQAAKICAVGSSIIYCMARMKWLGTYNFVVNHYGNHKVVLSPDWIAPISLVSNSDPVVVKRWLWNEISDDGSVIFRSFRPIYLYESSLHPKKDSNPNIPQYGKYGRFN